MTRPIALIVVAAVLAVALAVAVSERRVQAGFDAVRQDREGQLARMTAMARSLAVAGGGDDAARLAATRATIDDFVVAEARARSGATARVESAQREATATLRLAFAFSAFLTLILGLAFSLRLIVQATRLAASAERIARGNLNVAVPPSPGALGQLAPAVRRTAAALARRERETEALVALAALPPTRAEDLQRPDDMQLQPLLEDVRRAVHDVLDVRALTLVTVDGERVHRLGTSQLERRDAHYARAGSAVAAMLARGDAVVFDVDRGVHPEDATARAVGARAYAVVPLAPVDAGAVAPATSALVVDLGLCAVAVAELRFLGLVAHELSTRLHALQVVAERAPTRAQDLRSARST